MLSVMGVSHHNQSSFICSSFFFKPKLDLQKTIGCLRHHRHPRPLFLEIKMAQSRRSRIPLLVCPFSLRATYQRLLLNRPLAKANFCNHERSVVSRRVQGWIHLVSSNKDGAVSRGAMMMTIELRTSKRSAAYHRVRLLGYG